jgi:hypothetical protein
MPSESARTVIFSGSFMDASLLHSILEEEDIVSFIDNPNAVLGGFQYPTGVYAVQLVVETEDAEKAGALVQEFLRKREDGPHS